VRRAATSGSLDAASRRLAAQAATRNPYHPYSRGPDGEEGGQLHPPARPGQEQVPQAAVAQPRVPDRPAEPANANEAGGQVGGLRPGGVERHPAEGDRREEGAGQATARDEVGGGSDRRGRQGAGRSRGVLDLRRRLGLLGGLERGEPRRLEADEGTGGQG